MRAFVPALALLLILAAAQLAGAVDKFAVLYPADKGLYEEEAVSLVVRLGGADEVSYKLNGPKKGIILKKGKGDYLCGSLRLNRGLNRISVTAMRGGKEVASKEISVFVDVNTEPDLIPDDFTPPNFHTRQNEAPCTACHKFGGDYGESCFVCHKGLADNEYVHWPITIKGCLICHNTESNGLKYQALRPAVRYCKFCHGDKIAAWEKNYYRHGPTQAGDCTMCHDPHSSERQYFLRLQTTDLCVSCHQDKANGEHIVRGFSGKWHPVRGKPDPRDPSKELTCASCHNPHGSNFKHLLFMSSDPNKPFCTKCHMF